MPIGIQRLNQRKTHPNDRIVFIKALPGPSHDTAIDFLSRIAAICVPIMRANHLSVMSLEEHEPNPEFVGRNFNAGEIIQLVLKAPGNGRWLSFRYVQMVMMHELAHCKQMNHSRAFWAVRNGYAEELRGLWGKNYSGDGLWGRGQSLYTGQYSEDAMPDASSMPEHLCGGTYRSRGRKRKRGAADKPKLSYAERKQKRIEKKFGVAGEAVGGDENVRLAMERGKPGPKPRVAKSKRGRDLRAEAALLRFEKHKHTPKPEPETATEDSDEDTDYDDDLLGGEDAVGADGTKMTDSKGRGIVKVCGDEDIQEDADAQRELAELTQISRPKLTMRRPSGTPHLRIRSDQRRQEGIDEGNISTSEDEHDDPQPARRSVSTSTASDDGVKDANRGVVSTHRKPKDTAPHEFVRSAQEQTALARQDLASPTTVQNNVAANPRPSIDTGVDTQRRPGRSHTTSTEPSPAPLRRAGALSSSDSIEPNPAKAVLPAPAPPNKPTYVSPRTIVDLDSNQICAVCSLENSHEALTCLACAHVLDTTRMTRFWRCDSDACRGGVYVNSEDAGMCGLCGSSKS